MWAWGREIWGWVTGRWGRGTWGWGRGRWGRGTWGWGRGRGGGGRGGGGGGWGGRGGGWGGVGRGSRGEMGSVTDTPARDQRQYVKSRRLSERAEDADEDVWTKDPSGVTERLTTPNGVYVRYVSAPADSEEQDYAVRAGAMVT